MKEMKYFKGYKIDDIRLVMKYNDNFDESYYEEMVEIVRKKDWNLFKEIKEDYKNKGLIIYDFVRIYYDDSNFCEEVELNEEWFKLIKNVEVFLEDEDFEYKFNGKEN